MSDFDKEAEREKLQKKYADDEANRADTKRMSDLLLKGATMTNQHCEECTDPLFRYNGQTFCPTCQANGQQSAKQPDSQPATDGTSQSPTVDGDTQPTAAGNTQPAADGDAHSPTEQSPTDRQPESPTINGRSTPTDSPTAAGSPPTHGSSIDNTASPAADLTTARQSLIGTVTRFSQRAAKTDDPRRAKELLAAAREAAETLRALE